MGMIADLFVKLGFKGDEFNKGIDDSKAKAESFGSSMKSMGDQITSALGLDGIIGKISGVISSLGSFASSAANAVSVTSTLSQAKQNLIAAQEAVRVATLAANEADAKLIALQISGVASTEALTVAETEAAAASAILAAAQSTQATAQEAVTLATTLGSTAMEIFRVALASTGVGLLVVGLASLVAYFTTTSEGANKVKVVLAEVSAIFKVLIDRASAVGGGLVKVFTGDFAAGLKQIGGAFAGITDEMSKEGAEAGELAKRTQAVNKAEREMAVSLEERRAKAMQLRADAKLDTTDAETKIKNLIEARDIYKSIFADEKRIAKEKVDILATEQKAHNTLGAEKQKLVDLQVAAVKLSTEEAAQMKGLSREMRAAQNAVKSLNEEKTKANQEAYDNGIANLKDANEKEQSAIKQSYAARLITQDEFKINIARSLINMYESQRQLAIDHGQKIGEIDMKIAEERVKIAEAMPKMMEAKTSAVSTKTDKSSKLITQGSVSKAGIATGEEQKANEKVAGFMADMNGLIESGMENATSTFADGLGGLMSGDMNIGEFGASILASIGSFLVQMGKMLIAYAISMQAFKNAFSNPFVALAAGVALVAIGGMISSTAQKGMSSSSGGGGSAGQGSGGGNAGGYSPQSGASSAATALGGNVSFQIQGSSLVGVLANNDKKNSNYK